MWAKYNSVGWVEILGGKSWMLGGIICVSAGIQNKRKIVALLANLVGVRKFYGNFFVLRAGGVGW